MSSLDGDDIDDGGALGAVTSFTSQPDAFGQQARPSPPPMQPARVNERASSPPVRTGGVVAQPRVEKLFAVFQADGSPIVAKHCFENGQWRKLEDFRRPSADEYNSIMFNGKVVQGGQVVHNAPTGTNAAATMATSPLGALSNVDWKKWAVRAGVVTAAGSIAYIGFKMLVSRMEGEVDDAFEEEDDED